MSDFTVNDTIAEIRYEIDVREIFNDIRSEIGMLQPETVVDVDVTFSWKYWRRTPEVAPSAFPYQFIFTSSVLVPISWELRNVSAWYFVPVDGQLAKDRFPYYDYSIVISDSSDDRTKAVEITNTGSQTARVRFELWYKYQSADQVTHEQLFPVTLSVRATDALSIRKYGRRVMPLTWVEGTDEADMQSIVEYYLVKHKEPVSRLRTTIKGTTDALQTQIFTREISDVLTIVCSNLDINADYYIEAISIHDGPAFPTCKWLCEAQRDEEALTLFQLDTSELDGPHVLAS